VVVNRITGFDTMLATPLPRTSRISRTPLRRIPSFEPHPGVEVWAKLEWLQPGGSIKARAARAILAEALPRLNGRRLLDASSGNTAIAYATFCAAAGLPLTLLVPANASRERLRQLALLGAEVRLTDPLEGTEGARDAARVLAEEAPERFVWLDQYANPANWQAHRDSTAPEIWSSTRGRITHFVCGLGTTGTFTGTTLGLRARSPHIRCIEVQPETALHGLEGWKHLDSVPAPDIYRPELADGRVTVATEAAHRTLLRAARSEGLLLSPSSAANLSAAAALAATLDRGVVVTVFPDDASKYGDCLDRLLPLLRP
jgi:cysteine synthase B